ncbi:MAG: hypothetical protein J5528_04395 [Firmicutes bacterium]|nr:hypothetical protein [Bacillota bacterium]
MSEDYKEKVNAANTSVFRKAEKPVNEEIEKTLNTKIKRFRDAQQWKRPDQTPIMGHMITWQFTDAGYTLAEAGRDYEIKRECMIRAIKLYKFDHINCINSMWRNTFKVNDALQAAGGPGDVMFNAEGNNVNVSFERLIDIEDLPLMLTDYNRVMWEKALPRRYPAVKNYTPEQFAKAAEVMVELNEKRERYDKEIRYVYGEPLEMETLHFGTNLDDLFNTLIGIKTLGVEIRRHGDEIYDYCMKADDARWNGFKAAADSLEEVSECYDYTSGMLSSVILSRKQFERFHAPYLRKFLGYAQERGKQTYWWTEGSFDHIGDFYNDYKKGTVTLMIETDDPFEIRKKYPNICLQGGLNTYTLGMGTKEENIRDAQKAIDELGHDGGLVLAANKMLTYASDMKGENFQAVCEFVGQYKG